MTWEEFSSHLQEIRNKIKDACCSPPVTALSKKHLSEIEYLEGEGKQKRLSRDQEAWKQLRTARNRQKAYKLLLGAFMDVWQEILVDRPPLPRKAAKKQRALLKASKQAKKAGQQWIAALEAYQRGVDAVEPYPGLPKVTALESKVQGIRDYVESVRTRKQEAQGYVTEAKALMERFERIAPHGQAVNRSGQKRGRQEKKRLNMAILGLEDIFRVNKKVTERGSQIHSHCLLYTAGI